MLIVMQTFGYTGQCMNVQRIPKGFLRLKNLQMFSLVVFVSPISPLLIFTS